MICMWNDIRKVRPHSKCEILVSDLVGHYLVAKYCGNGTFGRITDGVDITNEITHWMYLPEPPIVLGETG